MIFSSCASLSWPLEALTKGNEIDLQKRLARLEDTGAREEEERATEGENDGVGVERSSYARKTVASSRTRKACAPFACEDFLSDLR